MILSPILKANVMFSFISCKMFQRGVTRSWVSITLGILLISVYVTPVKDNPPGSLPNLSTRTRVKSYRDLPHLEEEKLHSLKNYAEYAIGAYSIDDKRRHKSVCLNSKCMPKDSSISCQLPKDEQILVRSGSSTFAAMISTNHSANVIVVSFRGSLSSKEWLYSAQFTRTSSHPIGPIDVFIHSGFRKAYLSLKKDLNAQISQVHQRHPTYQIVLTGHSLGGALAMVCFLDIANNKLVPLDRVLTITFGQPRIGGKKLTSLFQSISSQHRGLIRVVNQADLIPHLPPRSLGYEHQGVEHWYNNGLVYKCDQDGENKSCSRSTPFRKRTMRDHVGYFGVYYEDLCLDET